MGMTDPIADMLTRIRNAGMAQHPKTDIPSSNVKVALAETLKSLGYIKNYKVTSDDRQGMLRVFLKYDGKNTPVIHEITRVSRPGRRVYVSKDDIPRVKNGLGAAILSTSQGLMDDESARKAQIGGEVMCTIW